MEKYLGYIPAVFFLTFYLHTPTSAASIRELRRSFEMAIFINSSSFYHFHLNVKTAMIKAKKEEYHVSHSDLR